MNAVEMISLYSNLFYVSMAVAVVGLGLAVFFFFYFDIPTVHALMTGKAKEDTIRRMAEQNAKTGTLKNQYMHTGPTGRTGKTKATGNTGALTENVAQPQVQQQPVYSGQTAPLSQSDGSETSVLQTQAQETTILSNEVPETQVLYYGSAETGVLSDEAGATAVLSAPAAFAPQTPAQAPVPAGFRFEVTESTLVIHTNEIIS